MDIALDSWLRLPDTNGRNKMTTFYEFKGALNFADAEIAKRAYEHLINNEKTYFYIPSEYRNDPELKASILRLEGKVLTIDDRNFGGADLIYSTADAITYVIGLSVSGKIIFQDGDPFNDQVNRYYLGKVNDC
jgi:hypothetical protein